MTFVLPRIFLQILGDLSQCVQTHQVHLWNGNDERRRLVCCFVCFGCSTAWIQCIQSILRIHQPTDEQAITYPDFSCPLVCPSRTRVFSRCSSLSAAYCSNRYACSSAVLASYRPSCRKSAKSQNWLIYFDWKIQWNDSIARFDWKNRCNWSNW